MKPVYLEFCGINSFSERAEINFSSLLEYGIFGIFGDTGSGKSTILDCICFALYGKVSRLDAKEAVIVNLINYNSDRAYVNFEFEIVYENERRIFRVERELKRKNSSQTVKVYEKANGALRVIADGVKDGNALLERIIGLEQKDFEKCIALPQGEFSQFVKSQKSDRLKLISRLFNLEGYGESLVKRANGRYAETKAEADVLKVRLEPYENITEEAIKGYRAQITELKKQEKQAEAALKSARDTEKNLSTLMEKGREAQKAVRDMQRLEAVRPQMQELSGELERLERAAGVVAASKEVKSAEEKAKIAEEALKSAEAKLARAEENANALSQWDFEKADAEILRLADLLAETKHLEADALAVKQTEKRLEEVQGDFSAECELFKDFSYEAEREKIEAGLASLGSGDFLAYVEEHGKATLLRGEYETFANEVSGLVEIYPTIAPEAVSIIHKYKKLAAGEKTDFSRIRAEYEAAEAKRAEEREKLVQLEKIKGKYEVHLARLSQLETERASLKARLEELTPRLEKNTVTATELEEQLNVLRESQRQNVEKRDRAREELAGAKMEFAAAGERQTGAKERYLEAEQRLNAACAAGGFANERAAVKLGEKYGDPAGAKQRVEQYKEAFAATRAKIRELAKIDFSEATEENYRAAKHALAIAESEVKECARHTALVTDALTRAERDIEIKRTLSKEYGEKHREAELYERLKKLLEGNKFMEFASEEYLQTVAANASGRLLSLTDGRYFLRYEGNFVVGDNLAGGAPRGVFTLSGGETFLVSLSLALALSAEICSRSLRPIEFFFLDEGFGTLDERLVDTVMDSLEKLKGEHFSIGIISHVEELRHRIERKLSVKKATDRHGSQITME